MNLHTLLNEREQRRNIQDKWTNIYGKPMIELKVNLPGWPKDTEAAKEVFSIFKENIVKQIGSYIDESKDMETIEGPIYLARVEMDALDLKQYGIQLEDWHPLGSFVELEVFTPEGVLLNRAELDTQPRRCWICGNEMAQCHHEDKHTPNEVRAYMERCLDTFKK